MTLNCELRKKIFFDLCKKLIRYLINVGECVIISVLIIYSSLIINLNFFGVCVCEARFFNFDL